MKASVQTVRLLPGEQDLGPGSGEHGQAGTDRDRVAQTHRTFGCCHADALVALATEELGALVGVVAQRAQDGTGSGQQPVLTGGGGELAETRAQDETTLHVTRDQSVVLEGDGETMSGRTSQSGGADELCQGRRPGFQGSQNDGSLVKNAYSARVVHKLILPSQSMRRKFTS